MIPMLELVIELQFHVHTDREINNVLDYVISPNYQAA
jgi:hypothetical protein